MTKLLLLATLLPTALTATIPGDFTRVDIANGYPLVRVMVNGRGPFRMLIDTGAQSCKLTPEAARQAALQFDERVELTSSVGHSMAPATRSAEVEVGGHRATGVEVMASGTEVLRQLGITADGVLGQSYLKSLPYLIDYRSHRLYLGDAARVQSAKLGDPLSGRVMADRVAVPVVLDAGGDAVMMTLDSGASDMVLWCRANCPGRSSTQGGYRVNTMAGSAAVDVRELRRVAIGGSIIDRPSLVVLPGSSPSPDQGLLPARLFAAVYVDTANREVRLGR